MAIFSGIIAALGAAGFTGSITIFGLSPALSGALIQIGKAVLWSGVAKAAQPGMPTQQVQAVISQATGPRIRVYGKFLVGGTRALFEVASDGALHQIIVAHHTDLHAIDGYLVDGEPVTIDGSGNVTAGASAGYLQLVSTLSGDGGDYADARAAFPGIWTTDHKLTGLATVYARMKKPSMSKLTKVFPRQASTEIQAKVRGAKVIDPRTMTLGYSDLTGAVAMDYLTHEDGYRIPLAQIDTASFAQFTALCDQNVPLKAGGTEKRYRVGGYYTLEDAPKDVMSRILATADAQLYMTAEGKCGILGGEWLEPDVTINASDILSIDLADGFDEFTDFNVLKGKFTSADHRWQAAECAELRDEVALLTQPERVETLEVDMCPSHAQMQRLLKAFRAGQIRDFVGTITTNLVGMKARFPRGQGKHVIRIIDPEFGIDGVFEITSHSYSVADRMCQIGIASIANPYAWDPATEEGPPPPRIDDLATPAEAAPVPTGLTLSQEIVQNGAGQNAVQIVALVSDPGREDLQLRGQYRQVGASSWRAMIVDEGDLRAYSRTVSGGIEYEVRAAWVGQTDWTAVQTITAVSNPIAPDAPTGFSSSVAGSVVTLNWTNADTGFYRTRIYRGTTTSFGDASLIATVAGVAGSPATRTDTPGTGTWRYWVVTINASLIESSPVGPQTSTV